MVYLDNKKYACESCIKGHRSSSCAHSDRPLFEIKKKGRPVSQCDRCRELRKSKKMHSKCTCNVKDATQASTSRSTGTGKSKRFVPIVPALPNGLKDYLEQQAKLEDSLAAKATTNPRQRVDTLLNPCTCKDVWNCQCNSKSSPGLSTLAHVAALFPPSSFHPRSRSNTPPPKSKRAKHHHHSHTPPLELPPIHSMPEFDSTMEMPPISTITSIADSGCTCGVECGCPGCVEHRGPENVKHQHGQGDCARGGCMHCVDASTPVCLPNFPRTSIINRFLRLSSSLPAPIPGGKVDLPKLECCGGKCGCPDGKCGCGDVCDGCCADHENERCDKGKGKEEMSQTEPRLIGRARVIEEPPSVAPAVRSCCAGKAKA